MRWGCSFEGLSHDGGGQNAQNALKISAPLPLIKIYQMIPLLARSVSLDFWASPAQKIRLLEKKLGPKPATPPKQSEEVY